MKCKDKLFFILIKNSNDNLIKKSQKIFNIQKLDNYSETFLNRIAELMYKSLLIKRSASEKSISPPTITWSATN